LADAQNAFGADGSGQFDYADLVKRIVSSQAKIFQYIYT
jgi:hypothetical protein